MLSKKKIKKFCMRKLKSSYLFTLYFWGYLDKGLRPNGVVYISYEKHQLSQLWVFDTMFLMDILGSIYLFAVEDPLQMEAWKLSPRVYRTAAGNQNVIKKPTLIQPDFS